MTIPLESLQKRVAALQSQAFQEAIVLKDGTKWIPKISPLELLVSLMEADIEPISSEVRDEAVMWAKYEPRPADPPFIGKTAMMARELVKQRNCENIF